MCNCIEFNDTIAFHPGYYIKEIVNESGLTQEDFAKRLDTTPKNLSLLVRGEQGLSIDIAMKLSRLMGVSVNYWLNLQNSYDALLAERRSDEELVRERKVFEYFDYSYFRGNYGLPDLQGKRDEQIKQVREFLNVATLCALAKRDMAVNFRNMPEGLNEASIIKANTMVQIATNKALKTKAPKYNKKNFENAVEYALTLTTKHDAFYPMIRRAFMNAGVIFVILPNISGSETTGATKKIGDNIMLLVNDRLLSADLFWFTLFHEIGHLFNGDYGISFEKETGEEEEAADKYAEDALISPREYQEFVKNNQFTVQDIKKFANQINRDPGIVLGRLQKDGIIGFDDGTMSSIRQTYKVNMV